MSLSREAAELPLPDGRLRVVPMPGGIEVGDHIQTEERTAVKTKESDNPHSQISINLTVGGASKHGIERGDDLLVHICENAIVIQPCEDGVDKLVEEPQNTLDEFGGENGQR